MHIWNWPQATCKLRKNNNNKWDVLKGAVCYAISSCAFCRISCQSTFRPFSSGTLTYYIPKCTIDLERLRVLEPKNNGQLASQIGYHFGSETFTLRILELRIFKAFLPFDILPLDTLPFGILPLDIFASINFRQVKLSKGQASQIQRILSPSKRQETIPG